MGAKVNPSTNGNSTSSSTLPIDSESAAAGGAVQACSEQRQDEVLQQQVLMVQDLLAAAQAFELHDCWQWKPLLDGKEVGLHNFASHHMTPVHFDLCAAIMVST